MTKPVEVSAPQVGGTVDGRFERVRDAFVANFADEDEVGAAVCVRVGDRQVVDLWGGHVDPERTRPWQRDTLVNAFSVGKGVLAMLLLAAVERREVDLDEEVTRYWPEFGAAGKGDVSVRMLASHQAGLPAVREKLPLEALGDWTRLCTSLAGQAPYWEPGARHGYHVNTYGFLVGELLRRATGAPVRELLARQVAGLADDAEFYYGLPERDHARAAHFMAPDMVMTEESQWARAFPPTGDRERDLMIWHCYFNPPGLSGVGTVNTARWRNAVVPSTNGHGSARGVAALYAALLAGGPGPATWPGSGLLEEARSIHADGDDAVLGRPSRFGIGFQLAQPTRPLGPNDSAFGHYGYGGSLGFADPEADLAFGYLMNRPGERWQTPRTQRLVDAVYASL